VVAQQVGRDPEQPRTGIAVVRVVAPATIEGDTKRLGRDVLSG
jgi:hypothetical protein